jgi:subtilisin family serine protease
MRIRAVRALTSIIVVAILLLAGVAVVAGAGNDEQPTRVIVLFDGSIDRGLLKDNSAKVDHAYTTIPAVVTRLSAKAIASLSNEGNVISVETDAKVSIEKPGKDNPGKPGGGGDDPPAQPSQVLPWGVDRTDAEKAWSTSTGDGVSVAVIDTGIDKDHSDLGANIAGGVNYVVQKGKIDSAKWDDDHGHGTHVAGTIAALNNAIGVVGVAPNADLYGIKVLNKRGSGYMSDVIKGIEWGAPSMPPTMLASSWWPQRATTAAPLVSHTPAGTPMPSPWAPPMLRTTTHGGPTAGPGWRSWPPV